MGGETPDPQLRLGDEKRKRESVIGNKKNARQSCRQKDSVGEGRKQTLRREEREV